MSAEGDPAPVPNFHVDRASRQKTSEDLMREYLNPPPISSGSIKASDIDTGEGRKDDQDKVRMELIPPEALEALGLVLTFGAKKYEDRNWEKGMSWSRPFGALMRHMWAWWRGDKADPETGYSHLDHALCCIVFLVTYERRKIGRDDRHIH